MAKKAKKEDRIDVLVDALDKYFFRLGSPINEISGSTWIHECPGDIRNMFRSKQLNEARDRFYDKAHEAEVKTKGITQALESAALEWLAGEEDFNAIVGFVLGLRVAGIPSERAKDMARTWRLGNPLDD
jgi:hypothetical protein